MRISGSHVLLSGASGGIGAELTRQLARQRTTLTLTGRDLEKLEALAAPLRAQGSKVQVIAADLCEPGEAVRVVAEAKLGSGSIDAIINCAGVQTFGFFEEESSQATERLFRINVLAPMALVAAGLPQMKLDSRGCIVNIGSIFGSIGFPFFTSYSASKFALRGFSEALRRELASTGIQVTYVAPRFTKTSMNGDAVSRMANELKMNQDDPKKVAHAVIERIERRGSDGYLGWPEKLFVRLNSIFPRLVDGSLQKQAKQMQLFAAERR